MIIMQITIILLLLRFKARWEKPLFLFLSSVIFNAPIYEFNSSNDHVYIIMFLECRRTNITNELETQ